MILLNVKNNMVDKKLYSLRLLLCYAYLHILENKIMDYFERKIFNMFYIQIRNNFER